MEGGAFDFRFGGLPEFSDLGFEGGVGGFVEGYAGADAVEIDAGKSAVEDDAVVLDFPNGGSLLEIAVLACVEDDAVAGFEGWGL